MTQVTHIRPVLIALALVLGLRGTAGPQPAEPRTDPLPAGEAAPAVDLQEVQDLLARATSEFDGPQQGRAIVLFDQIIERLEGMQRQAVLPPAGREILAQAYEMQGRAYFSIGLQEKAAQVFRQLIQLRPQHSLSRERISPKIVDFYANVKKALVGYLAVSSRPPGARVTLNGEFLSLTDFFPLEVLAGEYTVEISREGYQAETRAVSIAPRTTEALNVDLIRTSAGGIFVTQPPGVEIWIDGELRATTMSPASPEAEQALLSRGLDPARVSAPAEVGTIPLGTHTVEYRRRCHQSQRALIEVPEPRDYEFDLVRLEESLASLRLSSDPPGGRVYLDGELKGLTPLALESICSGPHRIEVKHAAGKFLQDVVLERNEDLALECPIRPTLAFLGAVADEPAAERVVTEAEMRIVEHLGRVTSLNLVRPSPDHVERLLKANDATLRTLVPGAGHDPEAIRRASERLAEALEVQGFVLAQLPEEKLHRSARLHLLAAGNSVTDATDVLFSEATSYVGLLSALDQRLQLMRPWSGMITVDAGLPDGIPVLRVLPGSPAESAGILAGAIVFSVDGRQISSTAELLAAVESKKAGDRLTLHLKEASGLRPVELRLGQTPVEVPLNDPSILYNKLMMDLRQQIEGYPGSEGAALARLNLALCSLHFRDHVGAHGHLLKAREELPAGSGISRGTALYYLGIVLERLDYAGEARAAYTAAAATEATILSNDGPRVADLVSGRVSP